MKKHTCRYYPFTHVPHKWRSNDIWFLRYKAWQTEFFVLLDHFLPSSPPLTTWKIKIWKNEKKKNTWSYYHFTHVYYKWQPYDVWFLRYGVQWTDVFVILNYFLPFYLENQIFLKMKKKRPGDIITLYMCTMNNNHDVWFLIYGVRCSWDFYFCFCKRIMTFFTFIVKFHWPENFVLLILLPDLSSESSYAIWLTLWFIQFVLLPDSNWNATRFIENQLEITRKVIQWFKTVYDYSR